MENEGSILMLFIFFLLIFIFVISIVIRYRKRIFENKELQTQFHHELLQTQIEIQEQTLKTISQEIHDNVGQILSLAKLNLNTVENNSDPKIENTKNLISKAISDLRNLSRSMFGDQLKELGLPRAIANELAIVESSGQYKTTMEITGEPFHLSDKKELVVFRMVQEAINNIIKHAKATSISVLVKYSGNSFCLSIADNGKGFDIGSTNGKSNGMGLKSIENRAELIGGSASIASATHCGTIVTIEIADAKN